MSDRCTFCEESKPTNHLVLNGGEIWLEFCKDCGEKELLHNIETDETTSVGELFNKSEDK